MLALALAFLTILGIAAPSAPQSTPANTSAGVFSSISLYRGNWQVTPGMSGSTPETLSNHCKEFSEDYACQQTVNGKVGPLIVFVYTGPYNTQAILPNGFAQGRGDLLIEGQRWTFSGNSTDSGKLPTFAPSMTGMVTIRFISKLPIPRTARPGSLTIRAMNAEPSRSSSRQRLHIPVVHTRRRLVPRDR